MVVTQVPSPSADAEREFKSEIATPADQASPALQPVVPPKALSSHLPFMAEWCLRLLTELCSRAVRSKPQTMPPRNLELLERLARPRDFRPPCGGNLNHHPVVGFPQLLGQEHARDLLVDDLRAVDRAQQTVQHRERV